MGRQLSLRARLRCVCALENVMAVRERVLLLIPRLNGGGTEQVMLLLARGLASEFDLHLGVVMAGAAGTADTDRVPAHVTVHGMNAGRARHAAAKLVQLVWRLRPAAVLTSSGEISFVTLLLRPLFPRGTSVLVRQNSTASSVLKHWQMPRYTHMLYRLLYRRADRLICQSHAMAQDLAEVVGVDEKEIAVLSNPVDVAAIREAVACASAARVGIGPHLLAVGRLSREKGFDLLLEAMATVCERFPGADLIIAGTGAAEDALKKQRRALGLETRVFFAGQVENVYAFFAGASLFVLPSRQEGMPNALLEAAAAGLPLVAMPACEGIVQLLHDEAGAWIAPEITADALAATLVSALTSLSQRARFSYSFFSAPAADGVSCVNDVSGAIVPK